MLLATTLNVEKVKWTRNLKAYYYAKSMLNYSSQVQPPIVPLQKYKVLTFEVKISFILQLHLPSRTYSDLVGQPINSLFTHISFYTQKILIASLSITIVSLIIILHLLTLTSEVLSENHRRTYIVLQDHNLGGDIVGTIIQMGVITLFEQFHQNKELLNCPVFFLYIYKNDNDDISYNYGLRSVVMILSKSN